MRRVFSIAAVLLGTLSGLATAETEVRAAAETAAQNVLEIDGAVNAARRAAGVAELVHRHELDAAALAVARRAAVLPGAPATPDVDRVRADLLKQFYIPMELEVLVAKAGSNPGAPAALWKGAGFASLDDPTLQEIGSAVAPNKVHTGPNDAYVWVMVLARPLRTPAESPDSPRFGK